MIQYSKSYVHIKKDNIYRSLKKVENVDFLLRGCVQGEPDQLALEVLGQRVQDVLFRRRHSKLAMVTFRKKNVCIFY